METIPTIIRVLSICALALPLGFLAGCAQHEPEAIAADDYFGGHGNMISPTHHVPREAQRVEPWFPLF